VSKPGTLKIATLNVYVSVKGNRRTQPAASNRTLQARLGDAAGDRWVRGLETAGNPAPTWMQRKDEAESATTPVAKRAPRKAAVKHPAV